MSSRLLPTWLGSYYGADFSFLEYEVLTLQHIPHKESVKESAVMDTRWFDYRRLHPMQATFYFVECYARMYGESVAKAFDHKKRFSRGFKGKSFLDSREKLSFWKLRHLIDKFGIRYDFFMREAMNWYFKRGWLHLPRPAHIACNEELFADVLLAWEALNRAVTQYPRDDWYRVRNFVNHPNQLAFERFLVEHVKSKLVKKFALHSTLYVLDFLRFETAVLNFRTDDVSEAAALVDSIGCFSHC